MGLIITHFGFLSFSPSLALHNSASNLQNIIFVSQLCKDNNVNITFSYHYFSVKDLKIKSTLFEGPSSFGVYQAQTQLPQVFSSTKTSSLEWHSSKLHLPEQLRLPLFSMVNTLHPTQTRPKIKATCFHWVSLHPTCISLSWPSISSHIYLSSSTFHGKSISFQRVKIFRSSTLKPLSTIGLLLFYHSSLSLYSYISIQSPFISKTQAKVVQNNSQMGGKNSSSLLTFMKELIKESLIMQEFKFSSKTQAKVLQNN